MSEAFQWVLVFLFWSLLALLFIVDYMNNEKVNEE